MAEVLPGYVLERTLGCGSMGTVHLARRVDWAGRQVAIKRVPHAGSGLARTLRHEAEVLAALDHPHIVRILDLVPDGDGVAIAMQFAAGGSVPDLLARRSRLTAGEVVAVAAPVADALASAHRRGLLHCDVKPANILFTSDGEPLLSDFGLARSMTAAHHPVVGTAEYLDPAVAAGGAADERSDVYGLGAVCYELLTGAPPYAGATPGDVVVAALSGPPPPLGAVAPATPFALVQAIERAMASCPDDRFAAAASFAAALRAAARPTPLGDPRSISARSNSQSEFDRAKNRPEDGPGTGLVRTDVSIRARSARADVFDPRPPGGADTAAAPFSHAGPDVAVDPGLSARADAAADPGPPASAATTGPDRRPTRTFGPRPPAPAVAGAPSPRTWSRDGLLVTGAVAALVAAVSAAVLGAGPEPPTSRAAAAEPSALRAPPCPAVARPRADVDGDGCPSTVTWAQNVAEVDGRRYELGRPGDRLLVGDWDCDGSRTPALYRPSTGEVFRFDGWAPDGHTVTATDGGRFPAGGVAVVQPAAGGCERVVVRTGPSRYA